MRKKLGMGRALAFVAALWTLGAVGARAADKTDADLALDPEMRRELEATEKANFENSLERAASEAGKAHARLRGLLSSAAADLKAGHDRLDLLLQDPEGLHLTPDKESGEDPIERIKESREALDLSGELLAAKAETYAQKASSASAVLASVAKERAVYNAKDREADLKRAQKELKLAVGRWGTKSLKPAQQRAVDALADCLSEMRGALGQAEGASALLGQARERPLFDAVARLRTRTEDASREAELLRLELLLSRYDEDRRSSP